MQQLFLSDPKKRGIGFLAPTNEQISKIDKKIQEDLKKWQILPQKCINLRH